MESGHHLSLDTPWRGWWRIITDRWATEPCHHLRPSGLRHSRCQHRTNGSIRCWVVVVVHHGATSCGPHCGLAGTAGCQQRSSSRAEGALSSCRSCVPVTTVLVQNPLGAEVLPRHDSIYTRSKTAGGISAPVRTI